MEKRRAIFAQGALLSALVILAAGCQTVTTVGGGGAPAPTETAMVSPVIPASMASGTAVVPPAAQVEEPLAPLLAGTSATLAGRRISIGEILESPDEFVGMAVQIVGDYVPQPSAGVGEMPDGPSGAVWGVKDSSGEILVVGGSPTNPEMGEDLAAQVLVVGEVARMADGRPYLAARGAEMLTGAGDGFDVSRLMEAQALADQLAAQGVDVRLAQVYIGTAQWLNLAERPGEANRYLNLAIEMLENPDRFKGFADQLPPRTPIHAFPTPPGSLVPLPESGGTDK
jgi:hypothetical protein